MVHALTRSITCALTGVDEMSNADITKNRKNAVETGRVLARVLSRDEVGQVAGGATNPTPTPTNAWKDKGTCTPKSDAGSA